jgi:DNA modification methylase
MDCVDGMGKLPHESVDLVFADPPYNLGVSYGNGHFSTDRHAAYIEWSHRWFEAVYRILKPGGSFYVMQYPEVCALWLPRLTAIFTFQRWITWHYPTNIGQAPNNWTRSHRAILFCTKGIEPNYFDGIADAQPYRNPTDKRIKELIANGAPGVTPYDTWAYNLVKNVSEDKTSWPNQIPVQLIERIIKVSCPKEGVACDPFMGSGSTAVAAAKNNRTWIGFDTLDTSKEETERRIG